MTIFYTFPEPDAARVKPGDLWLKPYSTDLRVATATAPEVVWQRVTPNPAEPWPTPQAEFVSTSETLALEDTDGGELSLSVFRSVVSVPGDEASATVTLPDGTYLGQRKVIEAGELGDTSTFSLDKANVSLAGATIDTITFDTAGDALLVEWAGSAWAVIYDPDSVVSVSE